MTWSKLLTLRDGRITAVHTVTCLSFRCSLTDSYISNDEAQIEMLRIWFRHKRASTLFTGSRALNQVVKGVKSGQQHPQRNKLYSTCLITDLVLGLLPRIITSLETSPCVHTASRTTNKSKDVCCVQSRTTTHMRHLSTTRQLPREASN